MVKEIHFRDQIDAYTIHSNARAHAEKNVMAFHRAKPHTLSFQIQMVHLLAAELNFVQENLNIVDRTDSV